jgi:aryl-alcohol dehydrogenase-like predicted oxidoreductase
MQTRPLGPGAPAVAAVGFGGMPLSLPGRPDDEAAAIRVVHAALDAGMTLLDTANAYCLDDTDIGHNERLIAKALRSWGGHRDGVVLATKGGITRPGGAWGQDGRPASLRRACERSLQALGTDCIALYQLHRPDPEVPLTDSVGALADLQREGKIRWVGLSNVTVEEIRAATAIVPVVTVQNRLNPFFREALETGVVAHCAEAGIGFLAYSPVGGGRLNKKLPQIDALRPIAAAHGASPHAVVLAWVLAQGPTVIVIPGARTVAHALDSAAAAHLTLSPAELAAIAAAEFSRA